MINYSCVLKLIDPSPIYGSKELKINHNDVNVYYARKNIQVQYPDFKIVKILKGINDISEYN